MSERSETPRILGGRYEVGELIGRGGMAEVHLGYDTRLGRTVAIKMLRADLARDHTFLTRFRREAQAAAGLNHHAIVAVFDSGEDVFIETGGARVDVPYIVMEYVEGTTLRDILNEQERLPADEAARITTGVLQALEYSHDRGIVHRDIKPANVMVTRGGSVKVMDFGIARSMSDSGATMTSMSAVVGTARYLSPEQAQGETVDARSDLYSAACVFYELLAGRTPFVGEPVSLVYQHIQDQAAPPSAYEPSVPDAFDAVTLHGLAKPRDQRYQHAADFRQDLQRARTGAPVSEAAMASLAAATGGAVAARGADAASSSPPSRTDHTADLASAPAQKRRRTGMWVLAGIVALAAILGIGMLLMNNVGDSDQVDVPQVTQTQQAEAEATVRQAGLTPRVVKVTDNDPSGTVVKQDPGSDAQLPRGGTVTLSVSNGPGEFTVPDVRGQTQDQAEESLRKAGITRVTVSDDRQDDTNYEAGRVSSSSPSSGTVVGDDQSVTLRLSSGKVTVPDLTGKSATEAAVELNRKGLKLKEPAEQRVVTDTSLIGTVVNVPSEGDLVDRGTEIAVVVGARARETVTASPTPSETPTSSPSSSPSSSSSSTSSPTSSSTSEPSSSSTPSPSTQSQTTEPGPDGGGDD